MLKRTANLIPYCCAFCSLSSPLFAQTFAKAVDALSHLFFAGLQEEFPLPSEALVRAMNMAERMPLPEIKKERDHNSGKVSQEKAQLKADESLMRRAREVNQFDLRLYDLGESLPPPHRGGLLPVHT